MKAIVRYCFMAYKFGCWQRVLLHLRPYNVSLDMLHRYVHWYTKLSSFEGYMGVHLDIDDLK